MNKLEFLARDLPSPEAAERFFEQFVERNASHASKLQKNEGLLSDVLALASYSPLLAATMIQSPEYVDWLGKERLNSAVRSKDELLESLARFSLTHSQLEPNVLFARFRRRELLRIFLRDIRRLGTIAEITEEISNLADAILENALRIARQEAANRYGPPFDIDEKGRKRPSDICIVSLGKLGSKELNYSSDIDLLFIYSGEGTTSGSSERGAVTNREYFVKVAEFATGLVSRQSGEGAAYRVDMRLRPHGRVGALALSLAETVKYYLTDARDWERQVLIRSRSSAGAASIFKDFFSRVEDVVFQPGRDASQALKEVLLSKQKIDVKQRPAARFDVKLGRGGIREIEFVAQALQLAHAGTDRWLRVPHSLISISRLADRHYLTEAERSELSAAYDFLRRLEHILQMEQGLQTHSIPSDEPLLAQVAAKMGCSDICQFQAAVARHTQHVHSAFSRVFERVEQFQIADAMSETDGVGASLSGRPNDQERTDHDADPGTREPAVSIRQGRTGADRDSVIRYISESSPYVAQMIASKPWLADRLTVPDGNVCERDYDSEFTSIHTDIGRPSILSELRKLWSRLVLDIAVADIFGSITPAQSRACQTRLAEASVRAGLRIAAAEVEGRYGYGSFDPAVIAFGKLGSGTLDYGSDLDVVIVYNESAGSETQPGIPEIYSRGVEFLVNLLSSMTRDGHLYRVDLRLRPHGKNGPSVTAAKSLGDYIESEASIWELLAYVQMRAINSASETPGLIESALRGALRRRAESETAEGISAEARKMRLLLEDTHGRPGSRRDIDIKFGAGGLLDVYFVTRCLHLINFDAIPANVRTTAGRLDALHAAGQLSGDTFAALSGGHEFLSELEHHIRLTLGRTSRFPRTNPDALQQITRRMNLGSAEELMDNLTIHRINIRSAFDEVLGVYDEP